MLERLKARLQNPDAAAIRLVGQLLKMPTTEAIHELQIRLSNLSERQTASLQKVLVAERIYHSQATRAATAAGQSATAAEMSARVTTCERLQQQITNAQAESSADPAVADVESVEKLQRYSALMGEYNRVQSDLRPHVPQPQEIVRLERLLEEFGLLEQCQPADYLIADLRAARANVLTLLGDLSGRAAVSSTAVPYYERAIALFEGIDDVSSADACRLKIADNLLGRLEIDEVIIRLMELLDQTPPQPASLSRANVRMRLAQTRLAAGDMFEAENDVSAVERELQMLNCPQPDMHGLEQTVERWVAAMEPTANSPNALLERLLQVVMLYCDVANARSKFANDLTTGDRHIQDLHRLAELAGQIQQSATEGSQQDQVVMSQWFERGQQLGMLDMNAAPDSEVAPPSAEAIGLSMSLERRIARIQDEVTRREQQEIGADDLLEEARNVEREARSSQLTEASIVARIVQADIHQMAGRYQDALRLLRGAYTEVGSKHQLTLGLSILERIAVVYMLLRDDDALSETAQQGIDLIEAARYNISAPYSQSAYLQERGRFYTWGVGAAFKLQQYDKMLERAELSKARATLRRAMNIPRTVAPGEIEREFDEICRRIDDQQGTVQDRELEPLLERRRTLWDLIAINRSRAETSSSVPEFSVQAVQQVLEPDEVVVYYYWLNPDMLLVVTIDQNEIVVEEVHINEARQAELVERVNDILQLKHTKAFANLNRLSEMDWLLPKDGRRILESPQKKRLIVSPHRSLHMLPFQAMRWDDDLLVRRFALSYVPNLSSLLIRYSPAGRPHLLAVGIREFEVPGTTLGNLPGAAREVLAIRDLWERNGLPVTVLTNHEATEKVLRNWRENGQLAQFSCLNFATHAEDVPADTPMESHVFLRNSRLDGLEIANWRLNADLVVLSACHSGQRAISGRGMAELPGDEIFGLQLAFFAAGARQVVGCLWPADDSEACQMIVRFHQYLLAKQTPECALQAAMVDHLNQATLTTRKVYYWAPFFISSMGRLAPSMSNAQM